MMGTNRPHQQQQRFPYSQHNQGHQGYPRHHPPVPRPQQQFNYNNNGPPSNFNSSRLPGTSAGTGRPATHSGPSQYNYNYQHQQHHHHQYAAPPPPPPPRPPRPPGMLNFVPGEILNLNSLALPGTQTQSAAAAAVGVQKPPPLPKSQVNSSSSSSHAVVPPGTESEQRPPPSMLLPPPPPPPVLQNPAADANAAGHYSISGGYPPLAPPPLPPMFPYMSVELAQSLEQGASQCGQSFEKEKSDLPFVPVIINDDDLKKMTETVKTQTEESKTVMDKLFYKDILDPNMPQGLREMLQPLYCKLCKLTLSSPVVARDHYKGKRHKKAEDVWLQENRQHRDNNKSQMVKGANALNGTVRLAGSNDQFNSRRPGPSAGSFRPERPSFGHNNNPVQPRPGASAPGANNHGFSRPPFNNQTRKRPAQQEEIPIPEFIPAYRAALANPRKKKPKKEGGNGGGGGPNFAYCDLCSISLTSQAHADQHYNGKNHKQKMLASTRNGEFGGDPRFGIGTGFAPT